MKLTKTSLAIAALFCVLGSTAFAAGSTLPETAVIPAVEPEVLDATKAMDAEADEIDTTEPEMNLAELQAEIRIACEEFAADEKVAEDKVPEFVDACVAENMPAEESDDTIEAVDNGVPAVEEAAPVVTGQAPVQE